MYDIPSRDDVAKVVVTKETVQDNVLPTIVPRLITLPDTRTLASGSGRSLASSFAGCTPAEAVIRQMEGLSRDTLEAIQVPALLLAILSYRNQARPG
jgi:hypothetical protein